MPAMWMPYGVSPHDFKIDKDKTKSIKPGGPFDPKSLQREGPYSAPHEVKLVDGTWKAVPVEPTPRRPKVVSPSVAPDQRPAGVKKPQMSQSASEHLKFGT